jgi:uncharacterized protein (DUF302 family)
MNIKILSFAILLSGLISNANAQEKYYFSKQMDVSYEVAIEKLKDALKDQNFGVVSETAMHETIMSKIPGVEMKPYIVIGACNAKIAHKVLQKEPNMGLLLPCKIVVKYIAEDRSEVAIINPEVAMSVTGNKDITPVLEEVSGQLKKVLKSL